MDELLTINNLIALLTLTGLEIVLGIDNVVFIAIIVSRLEAKSQSSARRLGLLLAMIMRIGLLFMISWIMLLTTPLFEVFEHGFSGRDLILLIGGLFLIGKATYEIHHSVEGDSHEQSGKKKIAKSFVAALIQIIIIDIVFSLDSVITAVGMSNSLPVMVIAIIIAVAVMMVFAERISRFIEIHPTLKMLALSFILLIGVMLVAEGTGKHPDKAYIYFAMGFSLLVETLNIRAKKNRLSTAQTA